MIDAIYRFSLEVEATALDENQHVNNVVYLEWIQEAASRHAEATGASAQTRACGAMWVVVEHRIRYQKPALLGDRIEVRTWVADLRRSLSQRRTEIVRLGDGSLLARGWTDWAFLDAATGKPKRIPPAVVDRFELLPE